ncbi:hypothetical protein RHGRI_004434 [Rhododendron griersonianum]|uniref:WDR11 first beta-propeller domain-containing protein n=1 Tax=Rhododendron griersonianum TaxID=479676 RepID=A0AAV6L8N1_9ERIC|nr:hypothetical protein RHGRI_004434 [Rhododendron griersonianum]
MTPITTPSSASKTSAGIQDLYWIQTQPDNNSFRTLAALSGPSLLSLYNTTALEYLSGPNRCFFKYAAAPEYLSCIRCDPFNSRRFCALGLKGFLLSVIVHGDESENDIV